MINLEIDYENRKLSATKRKIKAERILIKPVESVEKKFGFLMLKEKDKGNNFDVYA